MTTRCKPGDLAIVIGDHSQCADNIGRLVIVGTAAPWSEFWGDLWYIQAASPEPWHYRHAPTGEFRTTPGSMTFDDGIEHPDTWLQPIRLAAIDCQEGARSNRKARKAALTARRPAETLPAEEA